MTGLSLVLLFTVLFNFPAFSQNAFEIQSIGAPKLTMRNACTGAGGQGAFPSVTITHSKQEGIPIRVGLYDKTYGSHNAATVTSSKSGKTVVSGTALRAGNVRPPCNRIVHSLESTYVWIVTAGGSSKEMVWGRIRAGILQ